MLSLKVLSASGRRFTIPKDMNTPAAKALKHPISTMLLLKVFDLIGITPVAN
jgi:hypothetical protein